MTDVRERYAVKTYAHTFYGTADELATHMKNLGDNFSWEDLGKGEPAGDEHEWRILSSRQPDRAGEVVVAKRGDGSVSTGIPQRVESADLMWGDDYEDLLLSDDEVQEQMHHHHQPSNDDGWRVTDLGPAPEIEDALHPPRTPAKPVPGTVEHHVQAVKDEAANIVGRTTAPPTSRPDLAIEHDDAVAEAVDQLKHSLSDVWENVVGLVRILFAKS